jgi:hypothetical protein
MCEEKDDAATAKGVPTILAPSVRLIQYQKSISRPRVSSFFGSAGRGLGFYHIDLPELETTMWLNINNCGMVVIRKWKISMSELENELSEIFCKD